MSYTVLPNWLTSYRREWLRPDVVAGVTTAAVIIPKAMAYATIAGLPVQVGLYTAFLPMVIYAVLGTSRALSVSTTTTIAILAAAELGEVVPGADAATLLAASATLTLIVGAMLVLASILRLGFVANFISEPVLIGFKAGIGLVIVFDQLPKIFGIHFAKSGFFRTMIEGLVLQRLLTPELICAGQSKTRPDSRTIGSRQALARRLDRDGVRGQQLQAVLQRSVDKGELAGAVALIHRVGKTQCAVAGWRDIENHLPMERNTIFRIASMTKPITSVAALMLVDEGRIQLDDPISRVAPEFVNMRVLRSPDGPLEDTEEADRPITFEDLLTHRAGLTYASFHRGPIGQAYREALGGEIIDSHLTPDEWIRGLARLPLIAQPGSRMTYGTATDLLGFLIARLEGASLGSVLKRRIFNPLGMTDTSFRVPREKWNRRAAAYGFDEHGRLMKRHTWGGVVVKERPRHMAYESGSGGLRSTLDDYLRFARLFLGNGEVRDVRLLRSETLARMMTNQLTDAQRANSGWWGQKPFAVGRGFGLGVAVVLNPDHADMARRGSEGTVSWPGAYGGWWLADPKEKCIFVFLSHNMVDPSRLAKGIGLSVWSAIDDAQRVALA